MYKKGSKYKCYNEQMIRVSILTCMVISKNVHTYEVHCAKRPKVAFFYIFTLISTFHCGNHHFNLCSSYFSNKKDVK